MRINCTKEDPWTGIEMAGIFVTHHDTVKIGEPEPGYEEYPDKGDLITIKCLNCGKQWKEQLPL